MANKQSSIPTTASERSALRALLAFGLAALSLLATRGTAAAQPAPEAPGPSAAPAGHSPGDKPWAKGVTPTQQKTATSLFREGNSLLKDSLFVKAAEKYREALSHWDHPAIHYNLALALMNLDRPLEVDVALAKATQYGKAALDDEKFDAAERYQRLVRQQIASVTVTCDEPGTEVLLDGKQVFTGPGQYKAQVRIGEHSVVARKPGYITQDQTKILGPGDALKLQIKMSTPAQMTRYRRKYRSWKPWAVAGAGAAVLAIGGTLHALARSGYSDFDDGIIACGGCVPDSNLTSTRDSADLKQTIAFVSYAIGAAALATGAVLLYDNRARPYRVDLERQRLRRDARLERTKYSGRQNKLVVVPLITPKSAGIGASFRF